MKQYVEIYAKVHRQNTGVPFVSGMSGREAKSLKSLIEALKTFWTELGHALDDEQTCDALEHFLNSIDEPYILNRFVPSVIYSSFNELAIKAYGKKHIEEKVIRAKAIPITKETLDEIEEMKDIYERTKKVARHEQPAGLGSRMKHQMFPNG